MISIIKGKILANEGGMMTVLTTGGVGYKIFVNPLSAAWKEGVEAEVQTYLVVRENALDLYGFASNEERMLFEHFLSVTGIGPKSALHLLSLGSVEEIAKAVNQGDVAYLTRVSGVGKKTAERLVIELKGKLQPALLKGAAEEKNSDELGDVVEGLVTLGYSAVVAREIVKKLDAKGKTPQQLLKEALRIIK